MGSKAFLECERSLRSSQIVENCVCTLRNLSYRLELGDHSVPPAGHPGAGRPAEERVSQQGGRLQLLGQEKEEEEEDVPGGSGEPPAYHGGKRKGDRLGICAQIANIHCCFFFFFCIEVLNFYMYSCSYPYFMYSLQKLKNNKSCIDLLYIIYFS